MTLHEVALNHAVKRTNTCKLFWGTYAYCLKASIPWSYIDARRSATHQFWNKAKGGQKWSLITPPLRDINREYKQKVQDFIDNILGGSSDILSQSGDYYYLASDSNVNFYFETAEATAAVIAANPGCFHTYSSPASDAVARRLKEVAGRKVEVRQRGYYREFPYRITFKWMLDYSALDQRVLALQFEDSLFSQGDTRTLYVKSEDDFFLAKLGLSDVIESVSECLTIDEVENPST